MDPDELVAGAHRQAQGFAGMGDAALGGHTMEKQHVYGVEASVGLGLYEGVGDGQPLCP